MPKDNKMPRPDLKHPPEWEHDLNPNVQEGLNYGTLGPHPEMFAKTAYDIKGANLRLQEFTDDELKQIPVLPPGSRLEQNATYVDLHDPEFREFTAMGGMEADPGNWYVPKSMVDYVLWNRLIGVKNPERTDDADDSSVKKLDQQKNR